jgi:DNA-directed RNA polymerase specialized sigma24 family protein
MSFFDRPDRPRPACFDKPGMDWTPDEFDECVRYLFSGCNLQKNIELAVMRTRHWQDAEDAVQDYFASGFFTRKTVAPFNPVEGSFESWHGTMFAFGPYPFLQSWCRKRARYGRAKLLTPEEWEALFNEVESEGHGPGEATQQRDALTALAECLSKVNEAERDYVSRFYGCAGSEEEKHEVITRSLGISEEAGRKRLSRARMNLRKCLQERGIATSR